MRYKKIIWDWNGTLLDDVALSCDIFNELCNQYNLANISLEDFRNDFEFPVVKFYQDKGFDFTNIDFKEVAKKYLDSYAQHRFDCNLHSDVDFVLKTLKENGLKQSILSAYEQNNLIRCVFKYRLEDYFEDIVGQSDIYAQSKVSYGKTLVSGLDFSPSDVVMIGDTDHDKEVAEAIGIDCILMSKGHNSHKRLAKLDVPVFDNHIDILNYLI